MEYTKDKTKRAIRDAFGGIYNAPCINWLETTTDNEYYSEIISEYIFNHLDFFNATIPQITRTKSYDVGHTGKSNNETEEIEDLQDKISEKKTAKEIFRQSRKGQIKKGISKEELLPVGDIGKVLDYQTPLKNTEKDVVGEIDLLSETDDSVYILELKIENSDETLLRCVLEGYTYLRTVNGTKLLKDFGIDESKKLKTAPLIYEIGYPGRDLRDLLKGNRPRLKELMKELEVNEVFIVSRAGEGYTTQKITIN